MLSMVLGLVAAVVFMWLAFIVVLLVRKPDEARLRDAARLVPDVVRLVSRLARDHRLPRIVRLRLWFLLGYLASPIDLVPDFLPVIGCADDAIVVSLVLRSVIRSAGTPMLTEHWPGTPSGLETLKRLCRIAPGANAP